MSTAELPPDATRRVVTADELQRDFAGQRCELVEGEVREMSPTGWNHGSIERRIAQLLGAHVDANGLGDVATGEVGFRISENPDTVLAPDVSFVESHRLATIVTTDTFFPGPPTLAIEVTSPSDTANDVEDKARRWLAAGCEMVWVVYPRGRSVTVYRSLNDVKILTEDATLDGADVVPGFSCAVSQFFAGMR